MEAAGAACNHQIRAVILLNAKEIVSFSPIQKVFASVSEGTFAHRL